MDIDLNDYELCNFTVTKTDELIDMVDIQIEDDSTFHLSNLILTHNSAFAKFVEVRDPEYQAGMPLRGKVLNVTGKSLLDAVNNPEIADIITAIGLEVNEQLGDWKNSKTTGLFSVAYESLFELDEQGMSMLKTVVVTGDDRFLENHKWIPVTELYKIGRETNHYGHYIKSIEKIETDDDIAVAELSQPDYFHFRRKVDARGFRKGGNVVSVTHDGKTIVCYDTDEVLLDTKSFVAVSSLKEKNKAFVVSPSTGIPENKSRDFFRPAFNSILRYSQILIATDSDPDGSAIFNLLINFFHEYFPELLWDEEQPFVNRVEFPLIRAEKGKDIKYFMSRLDYEKFEHKAIAQGYKATYYKGLGSMITEDWEHIFQNIDKFTRPVYDDDSLDDLMNIFFGDNADIRKVWLSN